MFNYAYQIGQAIKIGVEACPDSKKSGLKVSADIGSVIFGVDKVDVVVLWRRDAGTKRNGFRLHNILVRRFKDIAVYDHEWIKATPDAVGFFEGLQKDPIQGNKWCTHVLTSYYHEDPEIV